MSTSVARPATGTTDVHVRCHLQRVIRVQDCNATASMVHAVEIEHDRVQPSEEVPAGVKETYLLFRLVERAENKLLGVLVVELRVTMGMSF